MKEFKGGMETATGLVDMLWQAAIVLAAMIMATWRDAWARRQVPPQGPNVVAAPAVDHAKGKIRLPTYKSLGLPEPKTVWTDKGLRRAAATATEERLAPIERVRAEAHYGLRYIRRKLDLDGQRRRGPHPYSRKLAPEMLAVLNSLDSEEAYTVARMTTSQLARQLHGLRQRGTAALAEVPPLGIANAFPPAPPLPPPESTAPPSEEAIRAAQDAITEELAASVPTDFGGASITQTNSK